MSILDALWCTKYFVLGKALMMRLVPAAGMVRLHYCCVPAVLRHKIVGRVELMFLYPVLSKI